MSSTTNRIARTCLQIATSLGVLSSLSAQTILHVDSGAAAGGSGASWSTAFDDLSDALAIAMPGDRVWVREGLYIPSVPLVPGDARTETFFVPQGVTVFGGFDGTETMFSQRAGRYEQTVLSGDRGLMGDSSDNCRSVVTVIFPDGIPPFTTTVDGFQIRDGNGLGGPLPTDGGGISCFNSKFVLRNCIVRDNVAVKGGGMEAFPGGAKVSWCLFENNLATTNGGAIVGQITKFSIANCVFRGNVALDRGGALFQNSTAGDVNSNAVQLANCVLTQNQAARGGAAFIGGNSIASAGKINFKNCTIAYNEASIRAGGILAVTSTSIPGISKLRNCIVWGNRAPLNPNMQGRHWVLASCIEGGGWYGSGNIDSPPRFVDGPGGDLRLLPGSPAIDAGTNGLVPNDWCDVDSDTVVSEAVELDLDGNVRIVDSPFVGPPGQAVVDMGAYETP